VVLPSYRVDGLPSAERTLVMGVLNVTPDSFSDGGQYADTSAAVARGLQMVREGADIVDVGGESTRPGAERVDAETEAARVLPVIRELAAAGAVVSVDTMRAAIAEAAVDAGARLVNDVSGGTSDLAMYKTVAAADVPYVIVHSRGPSADMQSRADYEDVVTDVLAELRARLDAAIDDGVDASRLIIDPGIGFAKTAEHNWTLLRDVAQLNALGRPLVVGASRKAFLGRLLAAADGTPRAAADRDDATTALTAGLATAGVWAVRVHDVRGSADAVRVVAALTGPAGDA
jgi:dihydropteroate synthase